MPDSSNEEVGMFGERLEPIAMRCCVCERWTALRVDLEDLDRHRDHGVYVQHAFVDRNGRAYLTAAERELFLSGCCDECWYLLCESDPLAYN
jgi:hypothetical protein